MPDPIPAPMTKATTRSRSGASRALRVVLGYAWRADRRLCAVVVAMRIAAGLLEPLGAVALALVVDAALRGDVQGAMWAASLFAVADAGSSALNHPAGKLELALREKTDHAFQRDLARLSSELPTAEHLELPEYLDKVEVARSQSTSLGDLLGRLVGLAQVAVLGAVTLVALATVDPLLLSLVLFGVPTIVWGGKAEAVRARLEDGQASRLRMVDRLVDLVVRPGSAKEVRVLRAASGIQARTTALFQALIGERDRAERRAVLLVCAGWLVFSTGFACAIALVLLRAIQGQTSPGEVLLVLALAVRLHEQMDVVTHSVVGVRRALVTARRLLWLVDYARDLTGRGGAPLPRQTTPGRGIVLDRVSFRYPGTDRDVLRDVRLEVAAGTTLAVVGDNGAGKTTLVNLLCGLYRPTAGRVLVDGVDLADVDPHEWRRALSACFQDFVRWELLLRESVGIGQLPLSGDLGGVLAAVRRAGGEEVVEGLPRTWDTQLGARWPGGVDLSGGQWQKIALARALMRVSPALLVLDEPSSGLDAAGEHALFERFARAGLHGRETGAITVLVSHRFSTVRMADRIVVVQDGGIAEMGAHDELMAAGGPYAQLYELQANGYR
ncbi:ABC transporter ATP-binding protein [Actinosynnema sp.]|uniref:ABC transporter ATP-binding protein n=1 Tax=Actinosynnema sp. TaxID=1872144 RepID=UPI003F849208